IWKRKKKARFRIPPHSPRIWMMLEDFTSSGVESLDPTQQYLLALVRAFARASSSWPDLIRKVDEAYKKERDDFKKTSLAVIRAKAEIILSREQENEK